MPIYEYKCSACQHEMESLQKFSDAPLVKCPACGKDALTKLVSAAGFQLKGSGWYQTDFRGGGAKPAVKPDALKGESGKDAARPMAPRPERPRPPKASRPNRSPRQRPRVDARASRRHVHRRRLNGAANHEASATMKRYLIAGLLVWVPLGITLYVLHFLVTTLDQTLLLFPKGRTPTSCWASTFRASACCSVSACCC